MCFPDAGTLYWLHTAPCTTSAHQTLFKSKIDLTGERVEQETKSEIAVLEHLSIFLHALFTGMRKGLILDSSQQLYLSPCWQAEVLALWSLLCWGHWAICTLQFEFASDLWHPSPHSPKGPSPTANCIKCVSSSDILYGVSKPRTIIFWNCHPAKQ